MDNFLLETGRQALTPELQEASRLPERLGDDFIRAAETIIHCEGRLIVSGINKSGHIGEKLTATFTSTGTPAFFVHPTEALRGDLGMLDSRDVILFISRSSSAKELGLIVPQPEEKPIPLLAVTDKSTSPLTLATKAVLGIAVEREACPMHLAPTSSTVNTLVPGDALAMAVMQAHSFNGEDFARPHPVGALGARLLNKVHHLMRCNEEVPRVDAEANVMGAIFELSRTGFGLVAVYDETNHVQDVFADGGLRHWLATGNTLNDSITQAMTRNGVTLQAESHAVEAKERLMRHRISAAPVMDENDRLAGAINLQNFYQAGIL